MATKREKDECKARLREYAAIGTDGVNLVVWGLDDDGEVSCEALGLDCASLVRDLEVHSMLSNAWIDDEKP